MTFRRVFKAALMAALVYATVAARDVWADASKQACGPFGNPPAKMIANVVPQCPEGDILGPWKDSDGTPRYACLYQPPPLKPPKPLPLIVFLHPSLANALSVGQFTNLLDFLKTANVSDDPSRPGFILLAPQGRNTTHYYPPPDHTGTGWDNWYRQFNPSGAVTVAGKTYPENVDAETIDHFIAAVEATGKVDRRRVYVTGWSNGGAMAYLYGLNRPGIAAVGVYSAADPFQLGRDPCPQEPVPHAAADNRQLQIFNPKLPSYQVHNSCDIAGICPNALLLAKQLGSLGGSATDVIIDRNQRVTTKCSAACGSDPNGGVENPFGAIVGMAHHLRWPKAWTAAILDFFRRHPLAHPDYGSAIHGKVNFTVQKDDGRKLPPPHK
jgi:predicted esterase